MSMHRMRAALTGLLETTYVDEWVVTEKVGDHVKDKLEVPLLTPVKPTECVERYASDPAVAARCTRCSHYVAGSRLQWRKRVPDTTAFALADLI
jgi:beta-mannan synthase